MSNRVDLRVASNREKRGRCDVDMIDVSTVEELGPVVGSSSQRKLSVYNVVLIENLVWS